MIAMSIRAAGLALAALALVAFAALAASSALAEPPANTTGAAESEPAGYAGAIAGAIEEYQAGHFAEARALFTRAHELLPNARTMRGLGMVEFELRNYTSSTHWLEQALASTARPLDPALHAQTEQLLQRARGFVGRYNLRLRPQDARVRVDGVPLQLSAGLLELEVGDHLLEVSAPDRAPDRRTLHVNGGEWAELEIALPEQARLTGTASNDAQPARDDDGGSVFASPWFWVALGAVVIGGGVATGIALSHGETREQEPYGGDSDVVLSGP